MTGCTSREIFHGQTLTSPGRWPVSQRRYPLDSTRLRIAAKFMNYADLHGPPQLLMDRAPVRVLKLPFDPTCVAAPKEEVVSDLAARGMELKRTSYDRVDLPIDFRFFSLLLSRPRDSSWQLHKWSTSRPRSSTSAASDPVGS